MPIPHTAPTPPVRAERLSMRSVSSTASMPIPVVLASQSVSRRNVLNAAGICPIIRVSHVDEPAVVRAYAERHGIDAGHVTIAQQVSALAKAKALTVFEAYRQVAEAARGAEGEQITAFPLRGHGVDGQEPSPAQIPGAGGSPSDRRFVRMSTATRDFSDIQMPVETAAMRGSASERGGLAHSTVGPVIIGCDSMFLFDGVSYGKPHEAATARERLRAMRLHSGELWTGHCVIDFASGTSAVGSSHAQVRFGDYSDEDIERYIATGEPLEVAGSFTLEGFGSAFIEGIDGDPHGVMGVSLPLLRHLVERLGITWTDLWNVRRGESEPMDKQQAQLHTPPKENVHQPGDGWVACDCGRRHWGTNGAAGILLARRDPETGAVASVVMQHRAVWSAEGGTWGVPGGAIADGESPVEGALRESFEEANIRAADIDVVGSYREDHGPWAYTTVFAFEKPGHRVEPRANDDESIAIAWVPIADVAHRGLLTALRNDWPRFAERLATLAAQAKQAE